MIGVTRSSKKDVGVRRKAPIVRQFMTRIPIELETCEKVGEAIAVMASHAIRHIPVMSGSHLKGVISQSDILQAQVEYDDALDDMALEEICQRDVLSVSPVTPIDQVAKQMLERKTGSAIVVDGDFVVGIFTTTDALRALSDIFG